MASPTRSASEPPNALRVRTIGHVAVSAVAASLDFRGHLESRRDGMRGSGQPMPMLTIVNPWDWLAADGSYPPIPRVSSTAAGRDGVMVESMV